MARFPERVGWYELLAPIGAGGMATVYLGVAEREGGFQRHVAVKMLHGTADEGQLASALLREAKLVAKIRHPNVVPVMDVGEDPYGLYLVMEYVEGDNLAALRRAAKRQGEDLPVPIALRIVTDALAGLHAAHELTDTDGSNLQVVHRDFSPHNILVGTDGVSRLTDFGIAKVAYTAGHTRTGKIKGKIAYMSPEQARAQPVDRRCDVWAAGVVAWEALSGQRLYEAEDEISALLKVVNEDPPRLIKVRPDIAPALDEAVSWALNRDVEKRCPSADALRRALMAAHPVADISEVATFVKRIVGPKLAERQQKIDEIRKLRGKLGELSAVAKDAASSPRASTHSLGYAPDALAGDSGQISGMAPEIRYAEQSAETDPGTSLATSGTVERILEDRRRRAALVGVATGLLIGLVGLVAIAVVVSGRRSVDAPPGPASAVTPGPVSTPASTVASPPLSAVPLSDLPEEPALAFEANADVASVKIGSSTTELKPPTRKFDVQGRYPAGTVVEVVSSDGRKVRTKVPESGPVRVVFPKRAVGIRPPPPATGGNIPFADNPYKKK